LIEALDALLRSAVPRHAVGGLHEPSRPFDARERDAGGAGVLGGAAMAAPARCRVCRFLWREVPDAPPLLILAAALASHQLGRGHACLDLAATLKAPAFALSLPPEGARRETARRRARSATAARGSLRRPEPGQWQQALAQPLLVGTGAGNTPLVCVGARLYLRRYWQYEQDVRGAIERRLAMSARLQAALPIAALRQTLDALFPPAAAVRRVPQPTGRK
jgi:hypothetical protein